MRTKLRSSLFVGTFVLAAMLGCGGRAATGDAKPSESTTEATALRLIALHPDETTAGQPFNRQPSGESALAVTCEGATNTTAIIFSGEKIATVYGGPTLLTAEVPSRLYAKAGKYDIYLQAGKTRSNTLKFEVR